MGPDGDPISGPTGSADLAWGGAGRLGLAGGSGLLVVSGWNSSRTILASCSAPDGPTTCSLTHQGGSFSGVSSLTGIPGAFLGIFILSLCYQSGNPTSRREWRRSRRR